MNCGNQVAEIIGKEERENMNCGNQVAENGRKKNFGNQVAKILGRNFFLKKSGNGFTEMEGKKNCGNGVAENWRRERERIVWIKKLF